jgi:hypothetical protein
MQHQKKKHTVLEAQRAQAAVGRENYIAPYPTTAASTSAVKHAPQPLHILPIPSIKRDLLKDLIFAVVAIAILTYLRFTHFGLAQLTSMFGQ